MRTPTEKEGPTVHLPRTEVVCGMCKFHECKLIVSGRNPEYEHHCTHPQVDVADPHTGGYIGSDDTTPDWCPVTTIRDQLAEGAD